MMDTAIKNAVLAVLHPLIRYLIKRGWTYPLLSELLKEIYFHEAANTTSTKPITNSRISLITGLHRKDVKRLSEQTQQENPRGVSNHHASLAARVVAEWIAGPGYRDSQGKPKPLPLKESGNKPSFAGLVKKVHADMRPNVILDELVSAGVAKRQGAQVRLVRNAYVPAQTGEKLAYLAANVGDHLESALHNIRAEAEPFLERAVYYSRINPETMKKIRPELYQLADEFLQKINRKIMPLSKQAPKQAAQNTSRMRMGVYYYEDVPTPSAATTRQPVRRKKPRAAPSKK